MTSDGLWASIYGNQAILGSLGTAIFAWLIAHKKYV